mmetsp:Transcript_15079/g.30554  ORF Transcript_15079/g.30554 Transcript_15079/m.30554 type:complete len:95 (-) Transcript_15079:46-330(-)
MERICTASMKLEAAKALLRALCSSCRAVFQFFGVARKFFIILIACRLDRSGLGWMEGSQFLHALSLSSIHSCSYFQGESVGFDDKQMADSNATW